MSNERAIHLILPRCEPPEPQRFVDAMNHFARDSKSSDEYCRGIAVGVVLSHMAYGVEFDHALEVVARYMPQVFGTRWRALPSTWIEKMRAILIRRGTFGRMDQVAGEEALTLINEKVRRMPLSDRISLLRRLDEEVK